MERRKRDKANERVRWLRQHEQPLPVSRSALPSVMMSVPLSDLGTLPARAAAQ